MDLPTRTEGNVVVAELTVEHLDASNAADFKQAALAAAKQSPDMVIDLGGIEFVDSSGLGALLSVLREVNSQGGKLAVCRVSRPVRTLFELVRMHRIFEIFPTSEEAVASFQ